MFVLGMFIHACLDKFEIKKMFSCLCSVRLKDRVTHVKIHGRGKKYDVGGGKQFDTIEDLIEYYKKCLLVDDKGIAIYLYQVCCLLENSIDHTSVWLPLAMH